MHLADLLSESRHPDTMNLDTLSTLEMVTCFNREDALVPVAVQQTLPAVAKAVDAAANALTSGGRLIYIGAGTSGRLGVLDASECPPTFGVPYGMVTGLIAGGPDALMMSAEGVEDSEASGADDLKAIALDRADMVIGLAASGRTPYVIGALRYAGKQGCMTAAICCNPDSLLAEEAQIAITPLVGPEVLTGSTRLKAGTAQKLVLNMISTGAMVKTGRVYQNLMVDLQANNDKLTDRACRIVAEATGCDRSHAGLVLGQCEYNVKTAVLMILADLTAAEADARLQSHRGFLRAALDLKSSKPDSASPAGCNEE